MGDSNCQTAAPGVGSRIGRLEGGRELDRMGNGADCLSYARARMGDCEGGNGNGKRRETKKSEGRRGGREGEDENEKGGERKGEEGRGANALRRRAGEGHAVRVASGTRGDERREMKVE